MAVTWGAVSSPESMPPLPRAAGGIGLHLPGSVYIVPRSAMALTINWVPTAIIRISLATRTYW